jgi:WD repeat-containing protein 22
MARPSPANPLGYLVKRQYNDRLRINKQLLRERLYTARNLYRKDLLAHYGCVNAIEFSNKGELLASGEIVALNVYVIIVYVTSM